MSERCGCVEHVGDRLFMSKEEVWDVTRQYRRIDGVGTTSKRIGVWCTTCKEAYSKGIPTFRDKGPWACEDLEHQGDRAIAERLDVYRERLEFRRADRKGKRKVETAGTICVTCVQREQRRKRGIADEQGVLL